ncbi:M24 family metallopeptidase [Vulcanisaeta thermophila]|uniref:M24 family metallopeptidase n=1 Tax=Vulcanisaeta thermophila TaxID=867917 RepID=UPI000853B644|nr:Xaa-Pro peptidase family protein [Vulcanisaeta thermophila]
MRVRKGIDKIKGLLDELSLDVLVIVQRANLEYITRFDGSLIFILTRLGDSVVMVPRLDYERALSVLGNEANIIAFTTYEVPPRRADERLFVSKSIGDYLLRELQLKPNNIVGIDDPSGPVGKELTSTGVKVTDISNNILRLREIKDEEEVNYVRRATEITDEVLNEIQSMGLEGRRENEIAGLIYKGFLERGAQDAAFKPIVASGPNGAYPHHNPTGRVIGRGEAVTIDLGARFNYYCTDITRTFGVGNLSKELRDMALAVLESQKKAINTIKPGVKASEVDLVARRVLEEYGYGQYYIHSTGHGVGVEIHERPALSPNSNDALVKGHVVTVEPGVYIKGVGGVRIEDTLVVTESGVEVLSKFSRDLF